jgi:hypothetical protein
MNFMEPGMKSGKVGGREQGAYMQFQLVTLADLELFRNEMLKEIRYLLNQRNDVTHKKWLRSHEVRKMLQISPGTLQHLRDTGQLPFSKLGGIIYYDVEVCLYESFHLFFL